jgi:hypothetical protein
MFNEVTNEWELDIDTLVAKFDGEVIFDVNSQKWYSGEEDPDGESVYLLLEKGLITKLSKLNEEN